MFEVFLTNNNDWRWKIMMNGEVLAYSAHSFQTEEETWDEINTKLSIKKRLEIETSKDTAGLE